MTTDFEVEARRRKYAQISAAHAADTERMVEVARVQAERAATTPEAIDILERVQVSGDVAALRDELQGWAVKPGWLGYNGFNGQMFLHQLVNMSPDLEVLAALLQRCLSVPASEEAAGSAIRDLFDHATAIKKGPQPAPKRAAFFCSFFWSLQDHDRWPAMWTSAEAALERLGWLPKLNEVADHYLIFRQIVLDLGGSPDDVELALHWFDKHPFTGLDPSLVDRCALSTEIERRRGGSDYASEEDRSAIELNARAVLGDLALIGHALDDRVAEALGRSVKVETAKPLWSEGIVRVDGWVRWSVARTGSAASLRVWATGDGVYVGLHPGWYREGWYDEAWKAIADLVPRGMHRYLRRSGVWLDPTPDTSGSIEFLLGRFYPGTAALDRVTIADEIDRMAADLQPAFDRVVSQAGGPPSTKSTPDDDVLKPLVEEFVTVYGYPTVKDVTNQVHRGEMADLLAAEEIGLIDLGALRSIYNGNRYGHPGPQSNLNVTIRDATPAELDEYLHRLRYLLWDETDPVDRRIDRLLDLDDLGIKGLGESVIMKLLAITHPDQFVPVFPFSGDMGKAKFLKLLDLPVPSVDASRGSRQVEANDRVRERLDPFFPNDPWGQAQFLYWLADRDAVAAGPESADALEELAKELLIERSFLDEVIALLQERGQVIFYGPPGTGKTYVARKLAEVLAPDPTRRMLVQFHPSTSYEDFFEGYRPDGDTGTLSYRLTKGPLALLAEKAARSPSVPHVMVIDEINRANLPKVLGELLYLLEYRDEEVRTLYRPEDAFSLPKNLMFIGTMNTADRSIALVDAALRRRFHFVPFFPNEGAIDGLLHRWLDEKGEPLWVAELVDLVNTELVDELGGPDLQLGPSYFMRKGLDEKALERIWAYNVFPLIQDTLFGSPERISQYRFDKVLARFRKEANVASVSELEGPAEGEA